MGHGVCGSKCSALTEDQALCAPLFSLVSLNEKTAATIDVPRSLLFPDGAATGNISCGRSDDNTVVIPDPRVSLRHFSIAVLHPLGASSAQDESEVALNLELIDESSNGTWVNDQKVGKENR